MHEQIYLGLLILCILGSAFYSGLETGIVSINRLRLRHMVRQRVKGAEILQYFLQNPDHLLGTMLVGNNLCNVVASVAAVSLGSQLWGPSGYTLAYVVATLSMLIFGEYLPKAWFQAWPAKRSLYFAKWIKINGTVLYPLSRVMTALAKVVMPFPRARQHVNQPFITKEEIIHLTSEGEKSGTFSARERRMIHRVFELTQKTCADIMIPKDRIILVHDKTEAEEILGIARTKGVSRLPVLNTESKRFVGILFVFDLLNDQPSDKRKAEDYMRPPQFVDAHTPLHALLPRFKLTRQPMALVTNQRSEVVGLVTLEDLLQEIVGRF